MSSGAGGRALENCPITAGARPSGLRFSLTARDTAFTLKSQRIDNVLYPVEESRGYQHQNEAIPFGARVNAFRR